MKLSYQEIMERWNTVFELFYEHDLEITEEMQQAMQSDLQEAKQNQ